MFCSECGQQAKGKYCSHCGAKLDTDEQARLVEDDNLRRDWSQEVRYAVLIAIPEVREAIESHAKRATTPVSGERLLELGESLLPVRIPMAKLAGILAPTYSKWGINTGKERSWKTPMPIGKAIVRVLCSLAEHGQQVLNVEQAKDGCTIQAALPSDVRSLLGELVISLHKEGNQTAVHAMARSKGQWLDWGKSRSVLEKLFGDLQQAA